MNADQTALNAVTQLDGAWKEAYRQRRPDLMVQVLAGDWMALLPDGRAVFRDERLRRLPENPPVTPTFERETAQVFGNTGITRGTLFVGGQRVQGFLRVCSRRDGRWPAVSVQVLP